MGQPKPEEPGGVGGENGHQLGGQSNEQLKAAMESEGGEGEAGEEGEEGEDRVSTSGCTKKGGDVLYASVGSWLMKERTRKWKPQTGKLGGRRTDALLIIDGTSD